MRTFVRWCAKPTFRNNWKSSMCDKGTRGPHMLSHGAGLVNDDIMPPKLNPRQTRKFCLNNSRSAQIRKSHLKQGIKTVNKNKARIIQLFCLIKLL